MGRSSQQEGPQLHCELRTPYCELLDGQVVELEDTRRSERRALCGMGVRISPWLLF